MYFVYLNSVQQFSYLLPLKIFHDRLLLEIMHPFLQSQNLQYTIVVLNQTGNKLMRADITFQFSMQNFSITQSLENRELYQPLKFCEIVIFFVAK